LPVEIAEYENSDKKTHFGNGAYGALVRFQKGAFLLNS
jgi:hypothetical protein